MRNLVHTVARHATLKGDKVLWAMIIGLMLFSVVVVFSSTAKWAYSEYKGNMSWPLVKQVAFFLFCTITMLVVQSIHYKHFISFAMIVLGVSIVGLLWAQIFPTAINDSARWVRIPGIGLTIQPSEIAKLGIVMYLARVIAFEQVNNYCSDKALMKVGIYTVFVLFLIFKENFSTSLLLGTVCLAMLFIGRLRWKTMFVLLGSLIVLASLFLVIIYTYPKSDDFARVATIKHRLDSFFVPGKEGSDTYQVDQSKIAIARGGLYGVGPGRSEQRNFLPNPFSDFIYAIIIEEYGLLIGGAVVLLIYLIILYRVGLIVRRCTRMFPALLVAGLGLTIVMQSLMHMMVCVGLFPVTGQPLPLVSMGGTSILLTGVAFGMIQSVAHTFSEAGRQEERERKEE